METLHGVREVLASAGRGSYQRQVLTGRARLSGADLAGKARKFAGRYAASREAAVARGQRAVAQMGWQLEEARGAHGRRYLVLVSPAGERVEV